MATHPLVRLSGGHLHQPVQRSRECPFAILALNLDDPARGLFARHHLQAALAQHALKCCNVTACQRSRVEEFLHNIRHPPSRAALHFLVQPRGVRTLFGCLLGQAFAAQIVGFVIASLGFKRTQDRPVEASWDNTMAPTRFKHPCDFLVPRVAPP